MNLASWIILGIVLLAVGLAIRSVFFKKSHGSCCSQGDTDQGESDAESLQVGCTPSACASCSMCCGRR